MSLKTVARLTISFLMAAVTVQAQPLSSLEQQIVQTAQSRTWLRLLHYDIKTKKSDITDPNFFLSPQGSTHPDQELLSAITQLMNEPLGLPEEERYSCRFPARLRFIQEKLNISPPQPCPTFEIWRSRAEPEFISFIYAAQFIGNPASAFGHSFLRFDRGFRTGLLGFSLAYFAKEDPDDNFALYAVKGLTGGYTGVYQFDHYYPKAHGYANTENRDLWEYQLRLTKAERQRIFEHAWELVQAGRTPYYFLDRNCTYQLLSLLEVGNEQFELTAKANGLFLTPQGTVKILARAGLIQKTDFRPSLQQKAAAYFEQLNEEQKSQLKKALTGLATPESIIDPLTSSTLVATLAMNELSNDSSSNSLPRDWLTRATHARARLPRVESPLSELTAKNLQKNPLDSHNSMQANVGVLQKNSDLALQFGFRPALHTFDEFATGFLPNTQLVFLESFWRAEKENQIHLHKLDFINIKSLHPTSLISPGFSWKAKITYEEMDENLNCPSCHRVRTAAAFGYAKDLRPSWLTYILFGPTLDLLQPDNKLMGRIGPSLNMGTLVKNIPGFVFKFDSQLDHFVSGPFSTETVINFEVTTSWQATKSTTFSLIGREAYDLETKSRTLQEIALRFAESF